MDNILKEKARYWWAVGYPEDMRPDWQDCIGEVLQLPYAYCIHNKDLDVVNEKRKLHIHIIIVFPNTTTGKNALSVLQELTSPASLAKGKKAFPSVKKVNNIRFAYEYLIHNTEDSKRKGKHLYDKDERITGNNFDIGNYEQLSLDEKNSIMIELEKMIFEEKLFNYADFYQEVLTSCPSEYAAIVRGNSGHFGRLLWGQAQRMGKASHK